MADRAELEQMLTTAQMVLTVLEQQAAGYTNLTIPAHLKVQLEEKRQEVDSLKVRLAQLQGGGNSAPLPDNLPRYNSVFVGRNTEIAQCLEALAPEERGWGAAIDGIGGMGKTALALEVAQLARQRAMFDAYLFASAKTTWLTPDGVRQETLALSSLDAFCREFARLLGQEEIVRITDSTERRCALLDALRGRRVLLIWDNLETLTTEEREQIAEFLRKLPGASKAIITSRRRTGESALTIRLDKLSPLEAFQMMQEKARLAPALAQALRATNDTVKQQLYDMAGGNPLALDWTLGLVAQKGYSLPVALERLRDAARSEDLYGFLFTDVARDLQLNDRMVLSALTVFQTPAALSALIDVTELASTLVEASLARLLILSLVTQMEGGTYGIHPLTRAYVETALSASKEGVWTAFQQLVGLKAQAGEVQLSPKAQRKALRYWVDYARKYGGRSENYKTFNMLEAEWQTLEGIASTLRQRSGIPDSLQDREAAQMLIDLEAALAQFLWFRGYWDERMRLGEWCYQAGQALGQDRDAGWGAYHVAVIHYSRGETNRAAAWADQVAAAMERGGSRRDRAVAIQLKGSIAEQRQDWAEAERCCQEVLAIDRELGNESDVAIDLNDLGGIARQQRQFDWAETYYQQALAIAEKIGFTEHEATVCGNLGLLALNRDRPQDARLWYERELALAKEVGRQDLVASAQLGMAQVLEAEGCYGEALALARQALQIQERLGGQNVGASRRLVERLQSKVA